MTGVERYLVNVEGVVFRGGRYLMTVRSEEEEQAPGALCFPGGKVDPGATGDGVLEATLRRELREEVGVVVAEPPIYLESNAFVADNGTPVVDAVFLCRLGDGAEPIVIATDEVLEIRWLTAEEVLSDPLAQSWTRRIIALAERRRRELGW